jgi:hypothetical protein
MTCCFFGHRDTPREITPTLKRVLVDLIENKNVNMFYVGNYGNFDFLVQKALKELKEKYPIKYYIVLAYIPKKDENTDYSNTIYFDELNTKPYRSRIIEANRLMLTKSDYVITYANTIGNARDFKELAEKQNKTVININM